MMDSYHLNCHHFKHLPASRQAKRQVAWFGNLNGKGISVRGHSGKRDGITKHGHLAVVSNWTSTRNEHFEIAKETRTCSGIRKTDGNCICSLLGFVASRWRLKSVCFSPPEAYDGDCQDYMEKKYQDPNSGSSIGWRGHEISFGSTDITTAHNTGFKDRQQIMIILQITPPLALAGISIWWWQACYRGSVVMWFLDGGEEMRFTIRNRQFARLTPWHPVRKGDGISNIQQLDL